MRNYKLFFNSCSNCIVLVLALFMFSCHDSNDVISPEAVEKVVIGKSKKFAKSETNFSIPDAYLTMSECTSSSSSEWTSGGWCTTQISRHWDYFSDKCVSSTNTTCNQDGNPNENNNPGGSTSPPTGPCTGCPNNNPPGGIESCEWCSYSNEEDEVAPCPIHN